MAVLEVRLLGELGAELDGSAVTLPTSRRACLLLGWLALRPGPHSRSRLAALLWPDVLDASARASLRSALWALRAALRPGGGRVPAHRTGPRGTRGRRAAGRCPRA